MIRWALVWFLLFLSLLANSDTFSAALSLPTCNDSTCTSRISNLQLVSQKELDLDDSRQFLGHNFGPGCHNRNKTYSNVRWIGFLKCDLRCSLSEQLYSRLKLGPEALIIYGAEGCINMDTQQLHDLDIPAFILSRELPETLQGHNWIIRFEISPDDDDISWLALRLVLGFMIAVVLLTMLTLWWLKPWRRSNVSLQRIYSVSPLFNPKSMLSKDSLDVFPTLNYEPNDRRKTTAVCKHEPKQYIPDRRSLPNIAIPPSSATDRRDSHRSTASRLSLPALPSAADSNIYCDSEEETVDIHYYKDTTCVICLGDYEAGERLRILSCQHAFHAECIDSWLLNPTASSVCPTCKSDLSAPLGLPTLPLPPGSGEGPIVRFEEILGIAMPVLIYPDDPDFHLHSRF